MRRVLRLVPTLVAILWVAGVAQLRDYPMSGLEWATVVAGAFALHAIGHRLAPMRPAPRLPEGTSPATVAALAAAILAVLATLVGGFVEAVLVPFAPDAPHWALRATWHAACTFAFCYCGFLHRLQAPPQRLGTGA
ncbi:MAG: hypothetical protein JNK15_13415 [Planctomycetes bacterium]|nr:hypothetical protein [Planctomycetota bacterium]